MVITWYLKIGIYGRRTGSAIRKFERTEYPVQKDSGRRGQQC